MAQPQITSETQLAETFAGMNRYIAKRSAMAAVKAMTFGTESLEKMQAAIADAYGMSAVDRAALHDRGDEDRNALRGAADRITAATGIGIAADSTGKFAGLARSALANPRVMSGVKLLATRGLTRAGKAARTGATVARATPWVAIAAGAYAVGSAGWFARQAYLYNQACHDLLLGRLRASTTDADRPDAAGDQARLRAGA